jgi:hypothetical protein
MIDAQTLREADILRLRETIKLLGQHTANLPTWPRAVTHAAAALDRLAAREAALIATLTHTTSLAKYLIAMIDPQTWRDLGGDDGQGRYEGDYWAEGIAEQIKSAEDLVGGNIRTMVIPPGATVSDALGSELKPPARVQGNSRTGWKLEAHGTDPRFSPDVRHRSYTKSRKDAEAFARIPTIHWATGHGIVFVAKALPAGSRRKARVKGLEDYITEHMPAETPG